MHHRLTSPQLLSRKRSPPIHLSAGGSPEKRSRPDARPELSVRHSPLRRDRDPPTRREPTVAVQRNLPPHRTGMGIPSLLGVGGLRPVDRHEERRIMEESGAMDRARRHFTTPGTPGREKQDTRMDERKHQDRHGRGSDSKNLRLSRDDLNRLEEALTAVDPGILSTRQHSLSLSDVEMLRYRLGAEIVDALIQQIRTTKPPVPVIR